MPLLGQRRHRARSDYLPFTFYANSHHLCFHNLPYTPLRRATISHVELREKYLAGPFFLVACFTKKTPTMVIDTRAWKTCGRAYKSEEVLIVVRAKHKGKWNANA